MTNSLARLTAALADRYRVERELGSGGMATVYLAEDIKHGRRVALKVLHPELAAVLGAERFLSEIKTTAHLQHPNILQLFDSGSADGLLYYVMPFVEGETLRGRLTREKQLPFEDAITIARGAAAALDYAHRHGVIHRDIKPENILLQDGQPLVADFGIALAVKAAGGVRLTQTGLSLGTPQYMSPEQATGERELDVRSDVYALGAVTYEMLAGEPPFSGNTTQAIIAKLMTEEPRRLTVLRKSVPPLVEDAVHRALEKLPADRFASAAQFAEMLARGGTDATSRATRSSLAANAAARPRHAGPRTLGLAVVLCALGAVIGVLLGRGVFSKPAPRSAPSRLAIVTAGEGTGVAGLARMLAISPDGETIAYLGTGTLGAQVKLRRLDAESATPVAGAELALDIHFSPDGRYLYVTNAVSSVMERVPIGGGARTPVTGTLGSAFLAWQADGTMWSNAGFLGGLSRISPNGGVPEEKFPADSAGRWLAIQQMLPGDREALVVRNPRSGNAGEAMTLELATGKLTPVLDLPVAEVRYTSGYLIYALPDNSLHAVAFDPRSRRTSGEPLQLGDDVSLTGTGIAQIAVAASGTVAYIPVQPRTLVLVDRNGLARPLSDARWNFHSPRFSPDGRKILVDFPSQDGRDVWLLDRDQTTLTRITFDKDGHDPVWTPDGKAILYTSTKSGAVGDYRTRPGGGGASDSVFASNKLSYTGVYLPDGRTVVAAAVDFRPGSGGDIVYVRPGAPQPLEPILASQFSEGWPAVSADGKWLAFASDQSGRLEVYVRSLSGDGDQVQVSLDGGTEPMWSRNGRELFYRRPRAGQVDLVVAGVQTSPLFRVIDRKTLFQATEFDAAQPHSNYDVSPDGKEFVMVRRNPSSHIVIIQNLPELMRRSQRQGSR